MKLSIVIPCYNEEKTIKVILTEVELVNLPSGWTKEIIVVNDGSSDGTQDILEEYRSKHKILSKKNGGKGSALKAGFQVVTGDYVLIQDADLEYHPSDFPRLLEPIIKKQSEIVFGSRVLGKNSVPVGAFYYHGGMLVSKIFNLLFRTHFSEIATCYKIFPSKFLPKLLYLPSDDFAFDVIELTHALSRLGKIIEVPITYVSRKKQDGKKLNWRHGITCVLSILRIKFGFENLIRNLRYRIVLNKIKPGDILDVGCGSEFHFLKSCHQKIHKGFGMDKKAETTTWNNIQIFRCNLDKSEQETLPTILVNQIFMLAVLEHVQFPEKNLRALYSLLQLHGEIIITTPTRIAKPILEFLAFQLRLIDEEEIRDHKQYFSKKELVDLFQNVGFTDIQHSYFECGFNHLITAKKTSL